MYPTNAAVRHKPTVLLQLNIFGEVDEIPVTPPKEIKASIGNTKREPSFSTEWSPRY